MYMRIMYIYIYTRICICVLYIYAREPVHEDTIVYIYYIPTQYILLLCLRDENNKSYTATGMMWTIYENNYCNAYNNGLVSRSDVWWSERWTVIWRIPWKQIRTPLSERGSLCAASTRIFIIIIHIIIIVIRIQYIYIHASIYIIIIYIYRIGTSEIT